MGAIHPRPNPVLAYGWIKRNSLNNNPDFYAPYPLYVVDFMPLPDKYGDLNDNKSYFHLIINVVGLQAASLVK